MLYDRLLLQLSFGLAFAATMARSAHTLLLQLPLASCLFNIIPCEALATVVTVEHNIRYQSPE
jgi:hypothetical protein